MPAESTYQFGLQFGFAAGGGDWVAGEAEGWRAGCGTPEPPTAPGCVGCVTGRTIGVATAGGTAGGGVGTTVGCTTAGGDEGSARTVDGTAAGGLLAATGTLAAGPAAAGVAGLRMKSTAARASTLSTRATPIPKAAFPPADVVPAPVCPHEAAVCGVLPCVTAAPTAAPTDSSLKSVDAGTSPPEIPALRSVPITRSTEMRALFEPKSWSAIASSPTVWKRFARSFSRHLAMTCSSPRGASGRNCAQGRRRLGRDLDGELRHRLGVERRAPRHELEEDDAERPDVGPRVDALRRAASARATCRAASP